MKYYYFQTSLILKYLHIVFYSCSEVKSYLFNLFSFLFHLKPLSTNPLRRYYEFHIAIDAPQAMQNPQQFLNILLLKLSDLHGPLAIYLLAGKP